MNLTECLPNQSYIITKLPDIAERSAIIGMGLAPKTRFKVKARGLLDGPIMIEVCWYWPSQTFLLMVSKTIAKQIEVEITKEY